MPDYVATLDSASVLRADESIGMLLLAIQAVI
jgi:hypothetical protein